MIFSFNPTGFSMRIASLATALAIGAGFAEAATMSQTQTFNQFENGTFNLVFDSFDSTLGTLNAVTLDLDSEVGHEVGDSTFEFRFGTTTLASFNLTTSGTLDFDLTAFDPNSVGIADSVFVAPGPATFAIVGEVSGTGLFPIWNGDTGQTGLTLTYDYSTGGTGPGPSPVPLPASLPLFIAGLAFLRVFRARRGKAMPA